MSAGPLRRAAAWGVHLFTASSAAAGVLALLATFRGDARSTFAWLGYTVVADAVDGTLARAVGVKRVLPAIDGARLDDIVDYLTYVVVPAVFLVHMRLLPEGLALPVACAVAVASAFGFANVEAKTADHFFTGFPSYWNVVAFYLYVLGWPPAVNAAIVLGLVGLVFVPVRYVYPSRTTILRPLTVGLGVVWGVALVWTIVRLDAPPRALVLASLLYPAYYFALSVVLTLRRA